MRPKVSFQVTWVLPIILMDILPWIRANTCRSKSYTVVEPNGSFIMCSDCVDCPPMLGATVPCNTMVYHDTDIACVKCTLGKTFSPEYNEEPCQPCKNTTCHRNEVLVGVCTLKEDNTRCNGTCSKEHYWSTNRTEPCQPCKSTTCHRNEEVVGVCGLKEDNTRCNGTCSKEYYWSTNRTEPCQPLSHLFTPPAMTDGGQSSESDNLVIKTVIPVVVILFIVFIIGVFCWCMIKKRQASNYVQYQITNDVESNDDSTNADNKAKDIRANNNGVQQRGPPSKYSDLPLEDVSRDQSSSSENVELDSHDQASSSLSTPGGTPTAKHKERSSKEPDLRRNVLLGKLPVSTTTGCKVKKHKIDNMNPINYRRLCQTLDKKLPIGDDYNILGGHLGYIKNEVDIAENRQKQSPTGVMLDDWGKKDSGNTVWALAKIVREKMKRSDVLEILDDELKLQREKCYCGSCPQILFHAEEPDAL